MIKIIVSGCNGRMGQVVTRMCGESPDIEVVAGFDLRTEPLSGYPVFSEPRNFTGVADAIIDFSAPASLPALLDFAKERSVPVVLCTTGYGPDELSMITRASKSVPVFKSGNMSLGINLLTGLVKKAARVLGASFDVEIIERHHRMKVDAPSGTAYMLADAVSEGLDFEPVYVYDRQSVRQKRDRREIGLSSVRGGTIVGEHEVVFAGPDEVVEFKHTATSREVFANGAITAARFVAGLSAPGMYDMNDALREVLGD